MSPAANNCPALSIEANSVDTYQAAPIGVLSGSTLSTFQQTRKADDFCVIGALIANIEYFQDRYRVNVIIDRKDRFVDQDII